MKLRAINLLSPMLLIAFVITPALADTTTQGPPYGVLGSYGTSGNSISGSWYAYQLIDASAGRIYLAANASCVSIPGCTATAQAWGQVSGGLFLIPTPPPPPPPTPICRRPCPQTPLASRVISPSSIVITNSINISITVQISVYGNFQALTAGAGSGFASNTLESMITVYDYYQGANVADPFYSTLTSNSLIIIGAYNYNIGQANSPQVYYIHINNLNVQSGDAYEFFAGTRVTSSCLFAAIGLCTASTTFGPSSQPFYTHIDSITVSW